MPENGQNDITTEEQTETATEPTLEERVAQLEEQVEKEKKEYLFLTNSSKTIFLVLWIVSMFIIASVLIVIEYQDYKLQKMFKKNADNEIAVSTEIAAPQSDSPSKERIEEIRRSIRSRIPTSPAENTASDSEKSETVNV